MVVRVSKEQASKMGLKIKKQDNDLLDPLLRDLVSSQEKAQPKTKDTRHKAPKVAKRLSDTQGPEGTGDVDMTDNKTTRITLALNLLPVPKERPRVVRAKSGKTVSFTPPRTKRFTQDIVDILTSVMKGRPPILGPVRLDMIFKMEIPTSWPQWKKDAASMGTIAPTSRPDMDNLEKSLLDALNGFAFLDDAYVVERLAKKVYHTSPGIDVVVEKIEGSFPLTAQKTDIFLSPNSKDKS